MATHTLWKLGVNCQKLSSPCMATYVAIQLRTAWRKKMLKKNFNKFWQTLKSGITRKRSVRSLIWTLFKVLLFCGRWIYRLFRFFEGDEVQ